MAHSHLRTRPTALLAGALCAAFATAASAEPISVTDQRGNTVELGGPAERVVTFPMPAAALFASVDGSAERLEAIHPMSAKAIEDGILGTIYPEAGDLYTDITKGGVFNPNVETVLTLNPDLVFQWAGRGDDLLAPLDNAGLNVLGLTYGDQEKTEVWIRTIAAVVGEPERGDMIVSLHHDAMADITARVADIPEADRVSVVYMLRAEKSLEVRGEGSYNHFYMDMVGGVNPAKDAGSRVRVNPEQMLAWNPDVILLGNFDAAVPEDFYTNPLFAELDAVKERRVYKVPLGGYRWDPPSQESPLMWKWLAAVLYPDAMPDDIRGEIASFYAAVYGYDVSDAEIDAILQMDLNGGNAGYDRFAG